MLRGNFGWSFRTGQPVAALIVSRLPITIELALLAVVGVALVAIPFGVAASVSRSAARAHAGADRRGSRAVPAELLDRVLLIIGASSLFGWLPALIYVSPWADPWVNLQQMFLPVLSLALGLSAVVVRMTRSSMLEVLGQDFIRVARAKGLASAGGPPASRAPERADPDRHRARPPDRASSWAGW